MTANHTARQKQERSVRVHRSCESPPRGTVVGALHEGEDENTLTRCLVTAPDLVHGRLVELLLHGDYQSRVTPDERHEQRIAKLRALTNRSLKRYVFRADTARGPRVIKIVTPVSRTNCWLGLVGLSLARREHHNHKRAESLGVAATRTVGFLEWRKGMRLLRACQIQEPMETSQKSLDTWLIEEVDRHGDAAYDALARALADTHRRRFFHADLKGFHAFPCNIRRPVGEPARYELRWLDLGRVSFWLSPRKRIINLYQVFRFLMPPRRELQARFVKSYCQEAQWFARHPEIPLRWTQRFLAAKLRREPGAGGM